nr:acyloxyacyl hydrolase [uncultured Carboxylicivirga sp.]
MRYTYILSLLYLFFLRNTLYGQDTINNNAVIKNKSIEVFYQNGKVLQTNDFVRGNNSLNESIDGFHAFSARFAWQTTGQNIWEQLYNYPQYGLGIYTASFEKVPELGNPIAIYGFFTSPFYNNEKLSISYDASFGITFNWESFELGQNPNNIAIGTEQSVYIDIGLKLDYQFLKSWKMGAAVSFTHFSNGALKKPNQGINTFAPKVYLSYAIKTTDENKIINEIPEFIDKNSITTSFYTGWKNVLYSGDGVDSTIANKGVYYNVYGLSATFNRQISYKSKVGLGITLGYFGAANSHITAVNGELEDNDAPLKEGFEVSIYPSYELAINKLSLILQPGIYLYRFNYKNQTPILYQRVGLKYHFWKSVFAGINLHANSFYISDYIEWNLGYTF